MIMTNEKVGTSHCSCPIHLFKRISWTAIFVGAFVAVGLSFLLLDDQVFKFAKSATF